MRKLLQSLIASFGLAALGIAQSPTYKDLKDARIDKDRPGVYLTFDHFGKAVNPLDMRFIEPIDASNSKQPGKDVWLRLHNNMRWPIQILTFSMYLPKRRAGEKPADWIRRARYLANDTEIGVDYHVQEKDGRCQPSPFDSFSVSRIPPGVSVIFSVPRETLSTDRSIFVNFNYEWEEDESNSTRPNEPEHRVEYHSHDLQRALSR